MYIRVVCVCKTGQVVMLAGGWLMLVGGSEINAGVGR